MLYMTKLMTNDVIKTTAVSSRNRCSFSHIFGHGFGNA